MPDSKPTFPKKTRKPRPQRAPAHRLRSVKLVLAGNSAVKIAKLYGDAPRTVAKWVERFKEHGLAGLEDAPHPGRPSTLDAAQERKLRDFVANERAESRPVSGGILVMVIKEKFGVTLTRRQCERILRRLNERLK